jgi:hypothetical protein
LTRPGPPSAHNNPKIALQSGTDSLEVPCPSSALDAGSDQHRASTPGCAARSGFFNLSVLYSPRSRHGLVSCRWHSWDFPFRAFPSRKSVEPLDARSPLDVSSRSRPYAPQQAALHTALSVRPPPGGFPLQSPFTDCRRLSRTTGPLLSWVSAPPRVSHDLRWCRLHGPFSHAL